MSTLCAVAKVSSYIQEDLSLILGSALKLNQHLIAAVRLAGTFPVCISSTGSFLVLIWFKWISDSIAELDCLRVWFTVQLVEQAGPILITMC